MIAVVALRERPQHADLVARWVWDEWRASSSLTIEQTRARLLAEPDCPATLLALADERGDEPAGVLGFRRFDHGRLGPRLLFVDALYVAPAARGRGVGSELLAHAIERAAAFSTMLYVYTDIGGWYEARGFRCVERDAASGNAVLSCETGRPSADR